MPTTNQVALFIVGSCGGFLMLSAIAPALGAFHIALISVGSTIASFLIVDYAFPADD
jgi:hypothetical protein